MSAPRAPQPGRAAATEARKLSQAMLRLPINDPDDDGSEEDVPIKLTKRQQAMKQKREEEEEEDDKDDDDNDEDAEQYEQEAARPSDRTNILPTREAIPTAELPVYMSCFFNDRCFTHRVGFSFGECGSIAAIRKLVDDHFQHEWRRLDLPETTVFVKVNCFAPKRPGEPDDESAYFSCCTETTYQIWWQRIMASRCTSTRTPS